MTNETRIHQIFYRDEQRPALDPLFIPYDNRENKRPDWCEYWIFRTAWQEKRHAAPGYLGYVSWKFHSKTGVSGDDFLRFIAENPGKDVYFINPFQGMHTQLNNVWMHGEHWHKGIAPFAQALFDKVYPELGIDISRMLNPSEEFAFCNYWAGTTEFWERYMAFCEPIYDYIEHRATPEEREFLDKPAVAEQDRAEGSEIIICYRPYIMERLFSTMLWLARRGQIPPIASAGYSLNDPIDQSPLALTRNGIKHMAVDDKTTTEALLILDTLLGYEHEYQALDAQKARDFLHYRKEQDSLEGQYHAMTVERDTLGDELHHRKAELVNLRLEVERFREQHAQFAYRLARYAQRKSQSNRFLRWLTALATKWWS